MSSDQNDPLNFYLRELATIPPLTTTEKANLLRQLRRQDEQRDEQAEFAARRLIEVNLSLVVSIAKRHFSGRFQLLDLIQSGNEGLLLAVKTFAGTSGGDFSAHAVACIEDAILKAIDRSPAL